jgi:hypothetical protein
MVGTLYLGALAAGARMARHLGDEASAERYETLLRSGAAKLDRLLWNGRYYVQKTDVSKPWQFGEGCLSDQLLGQWWAELLDLGKLLPHEHIRQALGAVYRHNFRESLEDVASAQRIYAVNNEQGLLNCSWPAGGRPAQPFGYSDELWTGVEYEVAAHLVFEGMAKEGVRIVEAVRARHDGAKRNPWDETEAGHHYARALSSWSLLSAFSGFSCSVPDKSLRFRPAASDALFRSLFSSGTAWGSYEQQGSGERDVRLRIEGGTLEMAVLRVPAAGACRLEKSSAPAECVRDGADAVVRFRELLKLGAGGELALRIV